MDNSNHRAIIVDDSAAEAELMLNAFATIDPLLEVDVFESGERALASLESALNHGNKLPNLILLDLNLPNMHGHELLEIIKENQLLAGIHVIIFSSSLNAKDIEKSYQLKANNHLLKPSDFSGLVELAKKMIEIVDQEPK